MTLRLFLNLTITIFIGFLIWFGITRIRWIQQYRTLFWLVTIINILIILVISFIVWFAYPLGPRTPAPPVPGITYGEFPFRFEYEVEGENFTIEGTVIAEFEYSVRGDAMMRAHRIWNTTIINDGKENSINERRFLLKQIDDISITFTPGLAEYFMGDLDNTPDNPLYLSPRIIIRDPATPQILTQVYLEDAYELLAEHGITLISWEHEPPIRNSFR